MSFIAGHFVVTASLAAPTTAPAWAVGTVIGSTESGINLLTILHKQLVISDEAGDVPIGAIVRGAEYLLDGLWIDANLVADLVESQNSTVTYNPATPLTLATYGASLQSLGYEMTGNGGSGNPVMAFQLNLKNQNSYGIPQELVAPVVTIDDQQVSLLLASSLRKVPITFRCYPQRTPVGYSLAKIS